MTDRKRVFSGIQPTGELHFGNLVGALDNWVKMQNDYEAYYCVVDLHAMTVPYDPAELAQARLDTAKLVMAAGVDPARSLFYFQSQVPQHAELTWILGHHLGHRPARADDPVQGKGGPGRSKPRIAVVSGADGGRHPDPPGPCRSRGRRSDPAPRIDPRPGRPLQLSFRGDLPRSRPDHPRAGRPGDVAPGPAGKDVEVRSRSRLHGSTCSTNPTSSGRRSRPRSPIRIAPFATTGRKAREFPISWNSLPSAPVAALAELEEEYADAGYGKFKEAVAEAVVEKLTPIRTRFKAMEDGEVARIMQKGALDARARAEGTMVAVRRSVGLAG